MLYIGCFTFNQTVDGGEREGSFQILAEAESLEKAPKIFAQKLDEVRAADRTLRGQIDIYLDTILEVAHPLERPVLVNHETRYANNASIHSPMPDESPAVNAFSWEADGQERSDSEPVTTIEFASFKDEDGDPPVPIRPSQTTQRADGDEDDIAEEDEEFDDPYDAAPIYLVRWPNLSFSLVRADSEEELVEILDEISDPGVCRWQVYKGPLFLDFQIPAKYTLQHEREDEHDLGPITGIELGDVPRMGYLPKFRLTKNGEETYFDMVEQIMSFAFPHLGSHHEKVRGRNRPNEKGLRAALLRELDELKISSQKWEEVKGRTDPEGLLMQHLGVTRNPFDDRGTRALYYLRTDEGKFENLDIPTFSAFMRGKKKLSPDVDGCVRYAEVNVVREGEGHQAQMIFTRIKTDGGIADQNDRERLVKARHEIRNARTFKALIPRRDEPGLIEASDRFELRRHRWEFGWKPSDLDLAALDEILERDTGMGFGPVKRNE